MKKVNMVALIMICSTIIYSQSIENEINKLAGDFSGEWVAFKLNEELEVVKSMSWKDTLRSDKPEINDSLAFVKIWCVMTFDNPHIPPYKLNFIEGFKIKENQIDSHFFTAMGVETVETKIGENTYVISQDISPFELKQLGIDSAIESTNTTIKVISSENEIEIHKITRITTITFIENSQEKTVQFVSLKGFHKRI